MGVYINMEMPTTYPLTVMIYPDGQVLSETVGAKDIHGEVVSVPEPHGRLGDLDALIEFIENRYEITWKDDYEGGIKDACIDILEKISTMPTVIPASKEAE